jgi:hypothetical protein
MLKYNQRGALKRWIATASSAIFLAIEGELPCSDFRFRRLMFLSERAEKSASKAVGY